LRITNGIIARQSVSAYQEQMRALSDAQAQASTGVRVSRPSDDPVAVAGIMQSSSGLRSLDQYQRNLGTAQSRLNLEDSVLSQLTDAMQRAKELAVSQAGDTASAATRATTNDEVARLTDFVKTLANTQLAGSYIFGGQYADSPPFTAGALDPAKPPTGEFQVEIGTRQLVDTNHSAQEIFVDSDVVGGLQALSDALSANDTSGIRAAMSRLDAAYDKVQGVVGDLGARMNHVDVASTNLDSLSVNLQTFRSGLRDADLATAVTNLVDRQTSLQAAMLANSKILNLTMTDYLQ
jgi:flagellar hook-associated protein 3 FlgL